MFHRNSVSDRKHDHSYSVIKQAFTGNDRANA